MGIDLSRLDKNKINHQVIMTTQEPKQNLPLGASIALLSWFSLATTSTLVKLIHEVNSYQILLCQNLFGLALILMIIFSTGKGLSFFKAKCYGLLFLRSMAGLAAFFLVFISIQHISIADATLLLNTGPLFVPFILWICFGEAISPKLWLGIIPGFLGIVLILKPGSEIFQWHALLPLMSGVSVAIIMIALRRLYMHGEPVLRILLYLFLFASLVCAPLGIQNWKDPTPHEWLFLSLIGIFSFFSQTAITIAMRYGSAKALAPLCYSSVLFALIYDRLIWGIIPQWISIIGMALVIIGGIIAIYIENQSTKKVMAK